jgi:hypothetical protein
MGLFLFLETATSLNFLAKWSFSFLNAAGVKVKSKSLERSGALLNQGYGLAKFMSHQELANNESITIEAKV